METCKKSLQITLGTDISAMGAKREALDAAFQSVDEKVNELNTTISTILKAMGETKDEITKNLT
jgi:uncharacterized coiled-coil DUF342 family protein